MEIRERTFNFAKTVDSEPEPVEAVVTFPRRVLEAAAGISGYSATFEDKDGDDHHLGRLIVELESRVNSDDTTQVIVKGKFGLRDWSGEWDDVYSGNIQYAVLAELEAVSPPSPGEIRGDLIIVDAECTQAIQHFRSDRHLDSANVFPDNSIRFVRDKSTAIRLYVDYDVNSGLPVIRRLSGSLEVVGPSRTETLAPLQGIVPRKDTETARGQLDHTLNFVIPEDLCRGPVTLRAQVFDAFDPSQFSRSFEKALRFDDIPPLPIMAVGIEYTGPDQKADATAATLAAPQPPDFADTLQFTENTYPTPAIVLTSYNTMTYDGEVKSDINSGCDKMGDLLNAVQDMRGDSEDIVLGLFNTGVDTGTVGGCGRVGAAVSRTGGIFGGTAAHEIGHALGRRHAPCDNVTRCAEPRKTDEDYPRYSGYDSDSIGEYGFNTNSGSVRDPAIYHDFMGYSGYRWISPYTYKALMSRIPELEGVASAAVGLAAHSRPGSRDRGEWVKLKQPHLFVRLTVHRDRSVKFREAFSFPVFPQQHGHIPTNFVLELLDKAGNVLKSARLYAGDHDSGSGCDHGCWPVKIQQAVPFDPMAEKLVIYEGDDRVIYEQDIPTPPKVNLVVRGADDANESRLTLRWRITGQAYKGAKAKGLWYLVQWRDARGTWRGVGPRTQQNTLQVPKRLFNRQEEVAIRVLATAGIATGQGVWQGKLVQTAPHRMPHGDLYLHLAGLSAERVESQLLPPILRLSVFDPEGRSVAGPQVRWYDSGGAELGRGRTLDLRGLPVGSHALGAAVLDTGQGAAFAEWMIERTSGGEFVLHRGSQ